MWFLDAKMINLEAMAQFLVYKFNREGGNHRYTIEKGIMKDQAIKNYL